MTGPNRGSRFLCFARVFAERLNVASVHVIFVRSRALLKQIAS